MLIAGYASIFNVVDLCNDIVMPGAFARSLIIRRPKMLLEHKGNTIGEWLHLEEDDNGLWVVGELNNVVSAHGLSIGYTTKVKEQTVLEQKSIRRLLKVELWEISLTCCPVCLGTQWDVVLPGTGGAAPPRATVPPAS